MLPKYRVAEHFTEPILSADPSVTVTRLKPEDEFMILASDGLWEHLSNQEAVDIVHSSPRQVSFTPKSLLSCTLLHARIYLLIIPLKISRE